MSKLRIAFLGPFGTFTEQALRQVAPEEAELIPLTSPPLAMKAVRGGRADWAVVPIENSIEGGVNATLDALADYPQLVICAEMLVPITFHLAVRPGTRAEDIRKIGTHPHAWAQCRNWAEEPSPELFTSPRPRLLQRPRPWVRAKAHSTRFCAMRLRWTVTVWNRSSRMLRITRVPSRVLCA